MEAKQSPDLARLRKKYKNFLIEVKLLSVNPTGLSLNLLLQSLYHRHRHPHPHRPYYFYYYHHRHSYQFSVLSIT